MTINEKDLKLYYSERFDSEGVFCDDYYLNMDIDLKSLKLQEDEVESVHWFSVDEIMELKKEDKFFLNHFEEFEILIDWLDGEKL